MTSETKRRILDQIVGAVVGALLAGAFNVFVVMRKLDRLEVATAERWISQTGRDQEQERRLNNLEMWVYATPRRTPQ